MVAGSGNRGGNVENLAHLESHQSRPELPAEEPFATSNVKDLPLAVAQRGMWIGEKVATSDSLFSLAECCELTGDIDARIFLRSLKWLTNEAETCRVQIIETANGPVQRVLSTYPGTIPYLDLSDQDDADAYAEQWMRDDYTRILDLTTDPLWFGALIKLSEQRFYFYHRCHHICLDGFGGGILIRRIAEIYNALIQGQEPADSGFFGLEAQLEVEQAYRESSRFQRDQAYWKEKAAGLPEPLTLAKGGERGGGLRRGSIILSQEQSSKIRALANELEGTVPQMLISLLAAYIYRMSGADDLVVGMPVSARVSRQQRNTPCMMANAVAIRLAMSAELTMAELLAQVSATVRGALRHQQYRYEELRRDLGLMGQGQQISWVGVNIEPFDYDLRFGNATTYCRNLSNGTVEDITTFVYDRGEQQPLHIDLDANAALYSQADIEEHAVRLQRLIDCVLDNPAQRLGDVLLVSDAEYHQLLVEWNITGRELPAASVISLFEQQASESPSRIAVTDGEQALSYQQLDQLASQYAEVLIQRGIGRDQIVAVGLPRSANMLVALLAVQKSGAAYLPLDPDAPSARIDAILEEAKPDLMLAGESLLSQINLPADQCLDLSSLAAAAEQLPAANVQSAVRSSDPAYVIYTSGSTGRPKGVVITHGNLLNFMLAMKEELSPSVDDRFLALTTIAFDIATLELYLPLISGASTAIASRDLARDPAALIPFVAAQQVTVMQATPSHWQMLLAEDAAALSGVQALVGGEALPAALAKELRQLGQPPVNLYGPTETTVWSTIMRIDDEDLDAPPIGRPIWNTRLYVLDSAQNPVPVGVVGELYIGGAGVAQGYLHRPELTAERFLKNPFAEGRIYRTGDLVRWREDGVLEYIGRNDFQIKIRGFRVEVGEIEAAINTWPGVTSSAVVLCETPVGAKQLVAYVLCPDAETDFDDKALRDMLKQKLPDYMVPALAIPLQSFPTNVNGKLDRRALPAPEWGVVEQEYTAPRNELEEQLAGLWKDLLGVTQVSVHDSFFDLGGDSIKAAMMVSHLRELLDQEIPLAVLFDATTIAELAEALNNAEATDPFATLLSIKPKTETAPLFCVHPVLGLGWAFAGLSSYLDKSHGLYAFQSAGLNDGDQALPTRLEDIAASYIQQMRQVQPQGPYRLLGWSMGGILAHEMARQLEQQGERIAFLGLLDAYPHRISEGDSAIGEAGAVSSALSFLGIDTSATDRVPTNMPELTEFLCQEYDVYNQPMVLEMQRTAADTGQSVVDNVKRVIENNLALLTQFKPGVVKADMLFVEAAESASVDMNQQMHHSPAVWSRHARSVEVVKVACGHQQMMDPENLQLIGPLVADSLQRADRTLWSRTDAQVLALCA